MTQDSGTDRPGAPLRRRRITRRLAWSAIVLAGCAALGVAAASVWIERSTRARRFSSVSDVPVRPVAIVLGARVHASGEPFPQLEDRLTAALEVFRAGRAQRILLSGDGRLGSHDEVSAMERWMLGRGVPAGRLVLDRAGYRTLETMRRAAQVFGVRSAIVCTQRYHLPRSLFLARAAGLDAVGLEANRRTYEHETADAIRERLARTWALLDVYLWRRQR